MSDIFHNGPQQNLSRILLGAGIALMQQACGVNIIANYLPVVLTKSVGLSDRLALIISAVYSHVLMIWATTSMLVIDSFGRRNFLLAGAAGQSIAFFMIAIGIWVGIYSMSIFTIVFIFVYNFFFGISFLSISWLYPAEINSQAMRNVGTSISTATNWVFVYVVVLVTLLGITTLSWKFYLIFGFFNNAMLPVLWLFDVETSKLSLEQIDRLFEVYSQGQDSKMTLKKARKQVLIEAKVVGNAGRNGLVMQTLGTKVDADHLEDVID